MAEMNSTATISDTTTTTNDSPVVPPTTPSRELNATTTTTTVNNTMNTTTIAANNTMNATTTVSSLEENTLLKELPFSSEDSISFLATTTPSTESINNIFNNSTGSLDFTNTTTEVADYLATTNENSTDFPYYYYEYYDDNNETNPFLRNDYNWYDYNDNDTVPYDYSAGSSVSNKTAEFIKKWENVNIPPKILPISFCPRDLNIYFLILPPLFCMGFLVLVFLPCLIMKWRDDIREMMGLHRKFGSNRNFKERKEKEDRDRAVEENTRLKRDRKKAAKNTTDIEYVTYPPTTSQGQQSSSNYDKNSIVTPGSGSTENKPQYSVENEARGKTKESGNVRRGVTTTTTPVDGDGPIVYTGEEISCIVVDKRDTVIDSDERQEGSKTVSDIDVKEKKSNDEAAAKVSDDGNFSTSSKTAQPKFSGWNKDLYSNAGGFGPPARRSSSPNGDSQGAADNPSWGMY